MNEPSKPTREPDEQDPEQAGMVASLLRMAGPRTDAPSEVQERVKALVHARWRQSVASRRHRRLGWLTVSLAAAAVIVLAIVAQTRRDGVGQAGRSRQADNGGQAGALILSVGVLSISGGASLAPGSSIPAGSTLETAAGSRAAIRLLDGAIIRLDSETRLYMAGRARLELRSGAIYVESGEGMTQPGRLEIKTHAGLVRDVGTRFEVREQADRLRIRVRQGIVALHQEAGRHEIPSGTELSVDDAGGIITGSVPQFGPAWEWILDVAPGFDLEGRSLGKFLDWVSAETGLTVRFAEEGIEQNARSIILHGSVTGLRPDRAPEVVLPTCGLSHRVVGDTLIVSR